MNTIAWEAPRLYDYHSIIHRVNFPFLFSHRWNYKTQHCPATPARCSPARCSPAARTNPFNNPKDHFPNAFPTQSTRRKFSPAQAAVQAGKLAPPGRPWPHRAAPGRPWPPLAAPGRPWLPLFAPPLIRLPPGASGHAWINIRCNWAATACISRTCSACTTAGNKGCQ